MMNRIRTALAVMALVASGPDLHAGVLATVVDSVGNVGQYSSLQLSGGNPVVSYHDSTSDDLKLATCTANCSTASPTWQVVTVHGAGQVGEWTSLQLNGANPVVSYYDNTNGDLKLATCTAGCASATPTWQIVTVDGGGDVGRYGSLQLNAGNPVISYHDATNLDLKLATCTANCATAAPTWQIVTVDSGGNVGQGASLRLNGGNPVISYWDLTNGDLKLATCTASCATANPTWQIVTVDSVGNVGQYSSLQLDGGNPVISYYDSTNADLKLATCTASCATATPTWQIVTVDSAGNVGSYNALELSGGNPIVSYRDNTNFDLKLATCTAGCATATPTWHVGTVDSGGSVGLYTSLRLIGGNPVVSYYDSTNADLKLAVLSPPVLTSVAVPFAGTYSGAGLILDFTVNWTDPIVVSGTPVLPLLIGTAPRNATYLSGSGSTALLFRYTVQAGDNDNDGIVVGAALNPNGGTLNSAGLPVPLALVGVGPTNGVLVNTVRPVIPSAGANGTISPNTTQSVVMNATAAFTVTPNAGYSAVVDSTCGGSLVGNTFTTNSVFEACSVSASFSLDAHAVTPSAGANGSISPSTPQTVGHGNAAVFALTPNPDYSAAVGGSCGGTLTGNAYTTSPIVGPCTVAATFTQITHTVTPSAGGNGSISPNTPQTVAKGATTAFTVTPNAGYGAMVGGTCGGALVGNTFTTSAITTNCTVAATFQALDPPYLGNISTRMQVLTGNDVMIGGFVIQGVGAQTVAIVATGPSLAAFGIGNPLADPKITLVRSSDQTVIDTNDNWQTHANALQLTAAGFAPSNSLEAAIYTTLQPGAYTAIVEGGGGGTGVAVVGVYRVN
jgi:hypothetical protein